MADPNVHTPEWEDDYRDHPVRMRTVRVGAAAGAQRLGASVYEVEAGGAVSPYHLHHANEELAIVLSGRPQLKTASGSRVLEPGAVVSFPPGPDGAHRLSNPGPEPARVLVVSTMIFPEVAEHISTGTTLTLTSAAEGKAFPEGTEQAFLELYQQAIARDAELDEGNV